MPPPPQPSFRLYRQKEGKTRRQNDGSILCLTGIRSVPSTVTDGSFIPMITAAVAPALDRPGTGKLTAAIMHPDGAVAALQALPIVILFVAGFRVICAAGYSGQFVSIQRLFIPVICRNASSKTPLLAVISDHASRGQRSGTRHPCPAGISIAAVPFSCFPYRVICAKRPKTLD